MPSTHTRRQRHRPVYVDDPIYAPKRAAQYLGISPRTLRALAAAGKIPQTPMPSTGTGKRKGYRRSDLNKYLDDLHNNNAA